MKIGVPKEIKNNEYRVGLVPGGVRQLVQDGHRLYVEAGCGEGVGISDQAYRRAGAEIISSSEEIFDTVEMIIKVKEPLPREIALLKPHHILYTFLHLAADRELTLGLLNSGVTGIAYETVQEADGSLPLLLPMSEVAGRMAVQVGAAHLQKEHGGKGVLLGGVPGCRRSKVTVIGCGKAGTQSLKMAVGMGADVTAVDLNIQRLGEVDDLFDTRITTLFSNVQNIEESVVVSDLVIGAVLVPGAKAPKLVTREMIGRMGKGSVVVDIAVDQGGCIETCRPTTHENPTFEVDGVIHYCVTNMPGAVSRTSTLALTNVTLKGARLVAGMGLERACSEYPALRPGINIHRGNLVYKRVAEDLDLPHTPLSF